MGALDRRRSARPDAECRTTRSKTVLIVVALGTVSGAPSRSRANDFAGSAHGVVRYNRFGSTMLPLLAYPSPGQAARYRC